MAKEAGKDVLDREHAEKMLYSGRGLPGGGQLEIRMEISADHPDPDIRGVARRVKFFNLESWHVEWSQVAEKNEKLAANFERQERNVTAHEFYLRAADFYRRALVYLPETDPTHAAYLHKTTKQFRQGLESGFSTLRAGANPLQWSFVRCPFLSGAR